MLLGNHFPKLKNIRRESFTEDIMRALQDQSWFVDFKKKRFIFKASTTMSIPAEEKQNMKLW